MVIAVIAILAALLLPVLDRARESARAASCTNLFHQTGLMFAMYTHESNECMIVGSGSWSNWNVNYLWGFNLWQSYGRGGNNVYEFSDVDTGPLHCPSVSVIKDGWNIRPYGGIWYFSMTGQYRFNGLMVRDDPSYPDTYLKGRRISKSKRPGRLVIWYETPGAYGSSDTTFYEELPPGYGSLWSAFSYGGYPKWFHYTLQQDVPGNANLLFADSHVEFLSLQKHNADVQAGEIGYRWDAW